MLRTIAICLFAAAAVALYEHHQVVTDQGLLQERSKSTLALAKQIIQHQFESIALDVLTLMLSENRCINAVLSASTAENRECLTAAAENMARNSRIYDQVRYIDEHGMEIVRINWVEGRTRIVPDTQLQDKSRRYYFTDTFALDRRQVFVSPMDLNVEHGQIQRPIKPMIRFGTPVFDRQGHKRGIVLVNYYGKVLLDRVREVLAGADGKPMLVNNEGYWLLAPRAEHEWGFMLDNGHKFSTSYPDAWQTVRQLEHGQLETESGLFGFVTVHPLHEGQVSSSGATDPFSPSQLRLDQSTYHWKILLHLDAAFVEALGHKHLIEGIAIYVLFLIVFLPGSVLLGKARRRQRQAQAAILQAEASSRIKSEFVVNTSHEIRTPMNGIVGMSELLLGTSLTEKQQRYATNIRNSAESLLRIINDVLDFSKIESGKMELVTTVFDLHDLIDEVRMPLDSQVRAKGLQLSIILSPDLHQLYRGDAGRLRQVLVNLAGNAVKFTEQGRITVNVSGSKTIGNSERVRFMVSDTGIGISTEVLANIFDTFTQADANVHREFGGTGLGLTISRQIIELMGGRIEVTSTLGAGSTFAFEVPLQVQEQQVAEMADHPNNSPAPLVKVEEKSATIFATPSNARGRVLLVEDNPVNQELAREFAIQLGYQIEVADNGYEALAILEQTDYDVVLMDCQMPVMDGFEATRQRRQRELSSRLTRLPIIALTANAMAGDRDRVLAAGMDDYLTKPFTREKLGGVLARWMRIDPMSDSKTNEMKKRAKPDIPVHSEITVLDEGPLEEIQRLQRPGKPNLLKKIINTYLETAPGLIEQVRDGILGEDSEGTRIAAHSLKSSSANLGANTLAEVCRALEELARENRMEEGRELVSKMDRIYAQVRVELSRKIGHPAVSDRSS